MWLSNAEDAREGVMRLPAVGNGSKPVFLRNRMKRLRFRLLSDGSSNTKLRKSEESEFLSVGLSLAPADTSGYNVCQHSTPSCRAHCVAHQGMASVFGSISDSRAAKTWMFFRDRPRFMELLRIDLVKAVKAANAVGKRVSCRLNMFSDIPWERMVPELFREFSGVQFYDYTKSTVRASQFASGHFPCNYHLTFSRSEFNEAKAIQLLLCGCSVAVVFPGPASVELPGYWHGFTVVDGDQSDLRFLDGRGVVVGLRAKGSMRNDVSGMVDHGNPRQSLLDTLL